MINQQLLNLFVYDEQLFAVPINYISRVVRAVEVTSVPNAPDYLLGVIDYHGKILPVLNFRFMLGILCKEIEINNRLIILNINGKQIAIIVDSIKDIISLNNYNNGETETILPDFKIKQIIRLNTEIVFVLDLEKILKLTDQKLLENLCGERTFN